MPDLWDPKDPLALRDPLDKMARKDQRGLKVLQAHLAQWVPGDRKENKAPQPQLLILQQAKLLTFLIFKGNLTPLARLQHYFLTNSRTTPWPFLLLLAM